MIAKQCQPSLIECQKFLNYAVMCKYYAERLQHIAGSLFFYLYKDVQLLIQQNYLFFQTQMSPGEWISKLFYLLTMSHHGRRLSG